MKRENGITLIALVITIIVLLILAGVVLATLTGQGNIIGNAENAVGQYKNSINSEQELINGIDKLLANYVSGGDGNNDNPPPVVEIPEVDSNGLAKENTTIKPDEDSNIQIVIPAGFAPAILATGTTQSLPGQNGSVASIMPAEEWNNITIEDINKGIVVVDHAITYDGGNSTGTVPDFNEFVWIPISESNKFARTAWNGPYYVGSWTKGEHPLADISTANAFWEDKTTTEYTNMVASVQEHKGFYVGRYEASKDSTGTIAQSKRNQTTWTDVTQIASITASTQLNPNNNSHLMYGIEWDSVLNWLNGNATISTSTIGQTKTMELADIQTNSTSWGNVSNSTGDAATGKGIKQNTGYSEYWKANNIYDLAGNVWEWTQEKYSTDASSASRGGYYSYAGDGSPAASHILNVGSLTHSYVRVPFQLICCTDIW